jgi:deoxyribonuclease-4
MCKLGYHVSISGSLDLAFDRAREIGCTCMQIFLSNPRGWSVKELGEQEVKSFRAKAKSYGVSPVLAHMPYLPNLASPKEHVYKLSTEVLAGIASRCELLGVEYLVTHLGSTLGTDKNAALGRVVEAVRKACEASPKTCILLENEAGQKNSVGSKLEELVQLYGEIDVKNVGFCADTCHLFAAGYDIRKDEVAEEVVSTLGEQRIRAIHLNDAKYPVGSGLDRHERIGFGCIGAQGFRALLARAKIKDKPLIMETPEVEGSGRIAEMRIARKLTAEY